MLESEIDIPYAVSDYLVIQDLLDYYKGEFIAHCWTKIENNEPINSHGNKKKAI